MCIYGASHPILSEIKYMSVLGHSSCFLLGRLIRFFLGSMHPALKSINSHQTNKNRIFLRALCLICWAKERLTKDRKTSFDLN